jgi:RNA polymerase sigma factor (sigma-70 family)
VRYRVLQARAVNVDIGSIDDSTARQLLADASKLIRITIAKHSMLDQDELLQVGRLAVLEAHMTFDDSRECSRETWRKRVLGWRINESVRAMSVPIEEHVDSPTNGAHDPEMHTLRLELLEIMQKLPPREATILTLRLEGQTFEQIGASIGLTRGRVQQCEKHALAILRVLREDT